jgi:hypothetical protein
MMMKRILVKVFVCFILFTSASLYAAESKFLGLEKVLRSPAKSVTILPYSISLASYTKVLETRFIKNYSTFNTDWVYFSKVQINGDVFYRLVIGNYANFKIAIKELGKIKKYFPGAWLNKRSKLEIQELTEFNVKKAKASVVE